MMSNSLVRALRLVPLLALVPWLGCVLLIREPQAYQEDVIELVFAGDEAVSVCYEQALQDRQLAIERTEREAQGLYADIGPAVTEQIRKEAGLVVVRFRVEAGTGKLTDPQVDATQTTAPAIAVECVLASLDGLVLEDPDHKAADVTLAWKMSVGKPKRERPGGPEAETETEPAPE